MSVDLAKFASDYKKHIENDNNVNYVEDPTQPPSPLPSPLPSPPPSPSLSPPHPSSSPPPSSAPTKSPPQPIISDLIDLNHDNDHDHDQNHDNSEISNSQIQIRAGSESLHHNSTTLRSFFQYRLGTRRSSKNKWRRGFFKFDEVSCLLFAYSPDSPNFDHPIHVHEITETNKEDIKDRLLSRKNRFNLFLVGGDLLSLAAPSLEIKETWQREVHAAVEECSPKQLQLLRANYSSETRKVATLLQKIRNLEQQQLQLQLQQGHLVSTLEHTTKTIKQISANAAGRLIYRTLAANSNNSLLRQLTRAFHRWAWIAVVVREIAIVQKALRDDARDKVAARSARKLGLDFGLDLDLDELECVSMMEAELQALETGTEIATTATTATTANLCGLGDKIRKAKSEAEVYVNGSAVRRGRKVEDGPVGKAASHIEHELRRQSLT